MGLHCLPGPACPLFTITRVGHHIHSILCYRNRCWCISSSFTRRLEKEYGARHKHHLHIFLFLEFYAISWCDPALQDRRPVYDNSGTRDQEIRTLEGRAGQEKEG